MSFKTIALYECCTCGQRWDTAAEANKCHPGHVVVYSKGFLTVERNTSGDVRFYNTISGTYFSVDDKTMTELCRAWDDR